MPETSTDTAQSTADDFSEFEKSRNAGEQPAERETEEPADASAKAGAAETAVEETDSTDDNQEPGDSKKKGIEDRFKHFTTQIRELRAQLAAKTEPAKVAPEVATPEVNGKPVAKNFQTYEAFNEALVDWKLAESARASEAKAATAKAATEANARFATFVERAEAVKAVHADYDEVVAQELPFSRAMHEVVLDSEHGPELAYYLGSNPEECIRISKLGYLAAAKALGVIEHGFAKAEEAPETPKPKVSTAPKPPSTVGGRASSTKDLDDPEIDFTDFERRRNRQVREAA